MKLQRIETQEDVLVYHEAFYAYLANDIVPGSDLGEPLDEDDLRYFHSDAYWNAIERLCARTVDTAHRYFLVENGERIGFCMCCTYHSEDGKCFVMEMCIFAPYRGKGYGRTCFQLLKEREKASYYTLCTSSFRARKFWVSLGFIENGYDEHGSLQMKRC